MFSCSLIALVLAIAAPSALANVFITSPVATTSLQAGQPASVNWQDDGATPNLGAFGPSTIGLFAGSVQQQTLLQTIADNVDVSKNNSVQFTPDDKVGPAGAYYFIRIQSIALKDANQPQYPAQAFSAKFMLTGSTGTFNPTVQAEVDGSSVAVGPSSAAAPPPVSSSSPASKTSSPTSSATSQAQKDSNAGANGAARTTFSGLAGLVGVVFIVSSLLF